MQLRLQHPRYLLFCYAIIASFLPRGNKKLDIPASFSWPPVALLRVLKAWQCHKSNVSIGLSIYCLHSNNCTLCPVCVCVCLLTYKFINLCVSAYLLPWAYILIHDIGLFSTILVSSHLVTPLNSIEYRYRSKSFWMIAKYSSCNHDSVENGSPFQFSLGSCSTEPWSNPGRVLVREALKVLKCLMPSQKVTTQTKMLKQNSNKASCMGLF